MTVRLLSIIAISCLLFISPVVFSQTTIANLRCEYQHDPVGISYTKPSLSWEIISKERNTLQQAYEVLVSESPGLKKPVWSSGKVLSAASTGVEYSGMPLLAGKKYYWKLRIWDNKGKKSAWSKIASWQMGFLSQSDWKAKWIESGSPNDSVRGPSPYFHKSFKTEKKVTSATAFITAHGIYEAFINGKRIGEDYLTPGWTSYNKRLQYQVYDVTDLLQQGPNAIGVALGSGWYRGPLAWSDNKNLYGKTLALLFQLSVAYSDGSTETIISDGSWKSATGAIRSSEIYDGEIYDANLEQSGWATVAFNDEHWKAAAEKEYPMNTLVSTINEGVKKQEILPAVKIFKTPKGELVADFGQNTTGYVELTVTGEKGDSIRIWHAEVLDKQGNFYTANLRSAKQLNTYVLKGSAKEVFRPHFTFQGFRYVMLEGIRGTLDPAQLKAVVLYSDMDSTGTFSSSSALLNQLQHNIKWGQMGNFLDVPTDCPQRDERLGWTGDAQVFSRTAAYNRQVFNFFRKWLKDVAADQLPNGSVPFVIPNVLGKDASGSTGWADVATIVPWNMWLAYGDMRILDEQYQSMKAWVGFMESNAAEGIWAKGFHFGDWLFYHPDDDTDGSSAITDKYLIAQCFFAGSTEIMEKTAILLGKKDDAAHYAQLLGKIKAAFVKEFLTPNGRLVSGSQTAYVLALQFDMLPEELRAAAAGRLAENIKNYGYHLTTGFLGTPYLCHVLSRFGYNDLAYTLLMQETYPSWLYPVKMGATTIWERWDGIKPDSSFQTISMNSFNHYAYGAIGDWMYRVLAGIDTDPSATGYKKISIRPLVNAKRLNLAAKDSALLLKGGLTEVSASLQTPYGKVSSQWKREGGSLHILVEIPANTEAILYLPVAEVAGITETGKPLQQVIAAEKIKAGNNELALSLGSGSYHFLVPKYPD